jgi:FKBP-type peptidyl-prolyl cis-trans isomerase
MNSDVIKRTSVCAATLFVSVLTLAGCSSPSEQQQKGEQSSIGERPIGFLPTSSVRSNTLVEVRQKYGDDYPHELDPNYKPKPPGKMQMTADGLQYQDLTEGWGLSPSPDRNVLVHYTAYLDGNKIESSLDRGIPFQFKIGSGKVIKGFEEGLMGMKVGGSRKVIIPPNLGYGAEGHGKKIPPNATLTYEIKLLSCDR